MTIQEETIVETLETPVDPADDDDVTDENKINYYFIIGE